MTRYIEIKSDDNYSEYLDGHEVASYLNSLSELKPSETDSWAPSETHPWLILGAYEHSWDPQTQSGGYSSQGKMPSRINLVEIICCYQYQGDPAPHLALAEKIATHFGWRVFDDD
jgi:hypothetical protein